MQKVCFTSPGFFIYHVSLLFPNELNLISMRCSLARYRTKMSLQGEENIFSSILQSKNSLPKKCLRDVGFFCSAAGYGVYSAERILLVM